MQREMGRPSLAEFLLPEKLGHNERLERIEAAVDWKRLGRVVAGIYASGEGRPSYPPLTMVKVLLLEQWYNLSDPQMEEALGDRLSFRRFAGLGLEDDTPDHSTISRFRTELAQRGVSERLFGELQKQLEEQGLLVKAGTLLDATLVAAQVRRPSTDAGLGAKSEKDPDADWTRSGRARQSHFGYKMHVGADKGTLLVRRAELTPAKVAESEVADRLVCGDELAVYGDRAYESKKRRAWLQSQGIDDCILHRSHKNQRGLPAWQQERNAANGPVRALVGEGVWHTETELRLPACAVPRTGTQRGRDVAKADCLQPAEGGGTDGIGRKKRKDRVKTAGTRPPKQHRDRSRPL